MCDTDDLVFASSWDVIVQTRRVQHRFEVAMDQALEAAGISYAQFLALETILAANEMHISELARRLHVTRQSATASVEKLQRAGYVTVEREAHRAYVVPVACGPVPFVLLRDFVDSLHGSIDHALEGHERGRLVALLRKAGDALAPPRRPLWWLQLP